MIWVQETTAVQLELAECLHASGDHENALLGAEAAKAAFGAILLAEDANEAFCAKEAIASFSTSDAAQNRVFSRKHQLIASQLVSKCHAKCGRITAARSQLEEALGCEPYTLNTEP